VDKKITELIACPDNEVLYGKFDPAHRDAALVDSVREYGVICPIVIDEHDNILKGHRRVAAATHCGHETVPTCSVAGNNEENFHRALYLARRQTVYSQCTLHRHRIQTYIAIDAAGDQVTGEEWFKLEVQLGYPQAVLIQGVEVLDKIEETRELGTRDDLNRAARVEAVFRDHGLAPVLRVLHEDDYPYANVEPDCGDWDDEETGGSRDPDVRPPACCQRPPKWAEDCYKKLAHIEEALKGKISPPALSKVINAVEDVIDAAVRND
jgi:hypothetical protein